MVEINNLTGFKFDKKILEKLAEDVLSGEKKAGTDLSITFVVPKEIQKLNKKYRKIDKPTDVLSFAYADSGEIIICPQAVKNNAGEFGENFKSEMARVFIHGILHVLGYDHGKKDDKMIKKQERYLKKVISY